VRGKALHRRLLKERGAIGHVITTHDGGSRRGWIGMIDCEESEISGAAPAESWEFSILPQPVLCSDTNFGLLFYRIGTHEKVYPENKKTAR